jgi:hypothetical protein
MPLNLAAARALLAGALLFSALTACGGDSDSSDTASPAPPTEEVSTPSAPSATAQEPDVRRTVEAAVVRLFRDGTGTYTVKSRISGAAESSEEGQYDLDRGAWSMQRYTSAPGVSAFTEVRRLGEDMWMRMDMAAPVKQRWDCWVNTDDMRDPETGAMTFPRTSPAPAPVVVADRLIGRERTVAGFAGTVPLTSALQLWSSKLLMNGALDPRSKERIPVELTVVEGRLRMITVQMLDLFTPLVEMGIIPELPDEMEGFDEIEVTFGDPGAPVTIEGPTEVGAPDQCIPTGTAQLQV